MSTWYLGPIGDLRALSCPEPSIQKPRRRYGGLHQGLSGARQMDITGFRQDVTLDFDYMEYEEWEWLDAMHSKLIPGPYYLIDPMRKNLLVPESSFPKVGGGTARGSGVTQGVTVRTNDWPTGVGVGGWSNKWTNRSAGAWFRTARNNPVPVNPGQEVTVSAYLKASVGLDLRWIVDYYDRNGQNGDSGYSANIPITTSWARYSYTVTVPVGIGAIDPVLYFLNHTPDIYIAAVQVELGPTATDWELGGGSMKALIEQMPTSSPLFPLTNVSVTILEA